MGDLPKVEVQYFLAGICGAGMSSLALLLASLGQQVRGSDTNCTGPEAESLRARGIQVLSEDSAATALQTSEVVVRSSAVHLDNPVLAAAGRLGLLVRHRSDVLASLASGYFLIAVSGTHGKTTTTGMIGYVLARKAFQPTVYVGGRIAGFDSCFPEDRTTARYVKGRPVMVLETDESDGSFLKFHADAAVVTNIDRDHLGTYEGKFENLVGAFRQFVRQSDERGGLIVGCGDDAEVQQITAGLKRRVLYGQTTSSDVRIAYDGVSNSASVVRGGMAREFRMIRGDEKSYQNAVAAALACEEVGVDFQDALDALESFPGMERRMQVLAEAGGVTVITDHADHPTEIRATLQAVSVRYPGRRVVLVLQPHRFSRVTSCLAQYGPALSGVDRVILLDIFTAGETTEQPRKLNDSLRMSVRAAIGEHLQDPMSAEQALNFLHVSTVSGDVVVFMGPGDVNRLGLRFCGLLSAGNAVECDSAAFGMGHERQENR